jgi:hypothetical protein
MIRHFHISAISTLVFVILAVIMMSGFGEWSTGRAQQLADVKPKRDVRVPVPGPLPINDLTIEGVGKVDGLPGRSVSVLYATTTTEYFLFPVFVVTEVSIPQRGGKSVPLFNEHGNDYIADTTKAADGLIEVKVIDLLRSNMREALLLALAAVPTLGNKSLTYPDITEDFNVALVFTDINEGGKRRILGLSQLSRVLQQDILPLRFRLNTADLRLLHGTQPDNLGIEIAGVYTGEFSDVDFRASLEGITKEGMWLKDKLKTAPAGQSPTWLVVAGGIGGQEMSVVRALSGLVKIRIEVAANNEVPGNRREKVDPALVQTALEALLAEARTQVQLQNLKADTVVSFLLSNHIRLTAALGSVDQASKSFETLAEKHSKEFFESLAKKGEKSEGGGGLDVVGIFSVGGSGASESLSEDQVRQLRDDFFRDLKSVQEMVKGNIPTVAAMKIDQVQAALSDQKIKKEINFGTFSQGSKTLVSRLSFQRVPAAQSERMRAVQQFLADKRRLEAQLKVEQTKLKVFVDNQIRQLRDVAELPDRIKKAARVIPGKLGHSQQVDSWGELLIHFKAKNWTPPGHRTPRDWDLVFEELMVMRINGQTRRDRSRAALKAINDSVTVIEENSTSLNTEIIKSIATAKEEAKSVQEIIRLQAELDSVTKKLLNYLAEVMEFGAESPPSIRR